MAELSRIRVSWTGWPGSPGVSTFFMAGTDYTSTRNALHTFFEGIKSGIPSGVVITVPSSGDIIDEASGQLTGQWASGTDQVTTATSAGGYAGGAGVLIGWHTSQIHNGRRLQGRTFIVPVTADAFDSTGHVKAATVSAWQTLVNSLVSGAANQLAVWGRPKAGVGGLHGQITDGVVRQATGILRSRRD